MRLITKIAVFSLALIVGLVLYQRFATPRVGRPTRIDYATLVQKIQDDEIARIKFSRSEARAVDKSHNRFRTRLESNEPDLLMALSVEQNSAGVPHVANVEEVAAAGPFRPMLLGLIPVAFVLGLGVLNFFVRPLVACKKN
jgi:hypothetical protein